MDKEKIIMDDIYWDNLSFQIYNGNVIPVIGPDLFKIDSTHTINQAFVESLGGNSLSNLDDVLYNGVYDASDLQTKYIKFMDSINFNDVKKNSERLVELLKMKKFPLILSLSPIPFLSNIVDDIWKDNWQPREDAKKCMNFTPLIMPYNDSCNEFRDIPSEWKKKYPFIVYLFGNTNCPQQRLNELAITEYSEMFYVRHLVNEAYMPTRLKDYLMHKYFLFIGCNMADWMFRFLYSAWRDIYKGQLPEQYAPISLKSTITDAHHLDFSQDKPFNYFLEQVNLQIGSEPNSYIPKLISSYNSWDIRYGDIAKGNIPKQIDVFISYMHDDREIAQAVCDALHENGVNAWFDYNKQDPQNRLREGANVNPTIDYAIEHSSFFIPIISRKFLESNIDGRYVITHEWKKALLVNKERGKRLGGFVHAFFTDIDFVSYISVDEHSEIKKDMQNVIKDTQHTQDFQNSNISNIRGTAMLGYASKNNLSEEQFNVLNKQISLIIDTVYNYG